MKKFQKFLVNSEFVLAYSQEQAMMFYRAFNVGYPIKLCYWLGEADLK
jgi:hypothetical protein